MAHMRSLQRVFKTFEKLKLIKASSSDDAIIKLDQLNEEWKEYKDLCDIIEDDEITIKLKDDIEEQYFNLKMSFRKSLATFRNKEGIQTGNVSMADLVNNQQSFFSEFQNMGRAVENDVELPKVSVPTFSGAYEEFPSFKDHFEASIHKNAKLSNVHKLQYLKGLLTGEAAGIIRHLSIIDANYQLAWDSVKERYDRKGQVVANWIRRFIEQPVLSNLTPKNLHQMADTCTQVLKGLAALGPRAESRDPWLIHILVEKLDPETRKDWAQETVDEDFTEIERLITFLKKKGIAMEKYDHVDKRTSHPRTRQLRGMFTSTTSETICIKCNENHPLHLCQMFIRLSIEEKKMFLVSNKLCFNCFKKNHLSTKCKSRFSCLKCRRRHHTLIHSDLVPIQDSETSTMPQHENASSSNLSNNSVKINTHWVEKYESVLPTAILYVDDVNGKRQACRAMLDSGAQASFISESCMQRLQIPRRNARIIITGLTGGATTTRGTALLSVSSRDTKNKLKINVLIINKLNCKIPDNPINFKHDYNLKNLNLADPYFHIPADIDIIIGADEFFNIMTDGKILNAVGNLVGQNTIFGWVLAGKNSDSSDKSPKLRVNTIITGENNENLDKLLQKFWETDEITPAEILSENDLLCEKVFQETTIRKNGRFEVRLPFRSNSPQLGYSKNTAYRRLLALERKLNKNSSLKLEYSNVLQEYLKLGHMKTLDEDSMEIGFYLPHSAVIKESTTTSVRVVFDGSSKSSNNISLNDLLLTGPTIQPTLWETLIRFRFHRYVLNSDVEKMYRQVNLHPSDQIYQKILWREHPNESVKSYQLTTVTFGLACSAFLAIRCLQQCAHHFKNEFPKACNAIFRDFYVDDLLTGADTIEEALEIKREICHILSYGGFNLRKWKSNVTELCEKAENNDHINFDDTVHKILGLQWDSRQDVFRFQIKSLDECKTTKRILISNAARIFDPMGWLAPVTSLIKILFQKLWLLKIDWDEEVPESVNFVWKKIKEQLQELSKIRIPRFITSSSKIQLHGFSDASERAYGAAVYIRIINENNEVNVHLLAAKSKVAPIKQISIPRLELCGALVLAKLLKTVANTIKNVETIYAWTDSMIVLHWISDHPSRWKSYIGNRTSELLSLLPVKHWNHVSSSDNPADYISRGVYPIELVNLQRWWNGPSWLIQDKVNWPVQNIKNYPISDLSEERKNGLKICEIKIKYNDVLEEIINRVNSYMKLIRIISYMKRFIQISTNQKSKNEFKSFISSSELLQSKNIIVKYMQNIHFKEEIDDLKISKKIKGTSKLISLAPFLDNEGVLRVGGRIDNAPISFNNKHPIILPNSHKLVEMIINHFHLKYLHPGPSLTSHLIREEFWIIRGRNLIRKKVNQCVICFKHKAILSKQMMGKLPACRLNATRAFENTGVDYAGPISISTKTGRGAKHVKGYIAVFVCLTTKAIHLELTSDLTAEAFISTFKRFISRRGKPKNLYSDNGKNFVGANRKLNDMQKFLLNKQINTVISAYLAEDRIDWHFIPPSAPNFGGLWEAAVKSCKTLLLKCLNNGCLTFEDTSTVLAEVEAILNSRPISAQSEDDSTYEALTPGHFLIGVPITSIPQEIINDNKCIRTRWQHIQARIQHFWKRFAVEYFNQLQIRNKWMNASSNFKINDLVLIKDDNQPSCKWRMGRIIEIHPGDDELVRVVTVKTNKAILKRPINKLAKIPIN